jgi:hypothetical protein
LSNSSKEIFDFVRKNIPVVYEDRVINLEMRGLIEEMKKY